MIPIRTLNPERRMNRSFVFGRSALDFPNRVGLEEPRPGQNDQFFGGVGEVVLALDSSGGDDESMLVATPCPEITNEVPIRTNKKQADLWKLPIWPDCKRVSCPKRMQNRELIAKIEKYNSSPRTDLKLLRLCVLFSRFTSDHRRNTSIEDDQRPLVTFNSDGSDGRMKL